MQTLDSGNGSSSNDGKPGKEGRATAGLVLDKLKKIQAEISAAERLSYQISPLECRSEAISPENSNGEMGCRRLSVEASLRNLSIQVEEQNVRLESYRLRVGNLEQGQHRHERRFRNAKMGK